MLPRCVGEHGTLPPGIHRATLGEVGARFVDEAPVHTRERRGLILDAMRIHVTLVRALFYRHEITIWLNGGFCTHKEHKPRDGDFACLVPGDALEEVHRDAALPLWTLGSVTGTLGHSDLVVQTGKLHCMGGLTDALVVNRDNPYAVERQRRLWSRVTGPDGEIIVGATKGFVEVIDE
jgi:uncharacterized protein DUF6932